MKKKRRIKELKASLWASRKIAEAATKAVVEQDREIRSLRARLLEESCRPK